MSTCNVQHATCCTCQRATFEKHATCDVRMHCGARDKKPPKAHRTTGSMQRAAATYKNTRRAPLPRHTAKRSGSTTARPIEGTLRRSGTGGEPSTSARVAGGSAIDARRPRRRRFAHTAQPWECAAPTCRHLCVCVCTDVRACVQASPSPLQRNAWRPPARQRQAARCGSARRNATKAVASPGADVARFGFRRGCVAHAVLRRAMPATAELTGSDAADSHAVAPPEHDQHPYHGHERP
jgi:hypothetical protein